MLGRLESLHKGIEFGAELLSFDPTFTRFNLIKSFRHRSFPRELARAQTRVPFTPGYVVSPLSLSLPAFGVVERNVESHDE